MPKLVIGSPAPLFRLDDLDGNPVALEDFIGKIVLINFWSAECPWVERSDGALAGWQDRLVLLSIAVNANEPPDMLYEAAAERGLRTILRDPGLLTADLYGVEITPHYFLVDPAGILRYQGAFDDVSFRQRSPTRAYLLEAIDALSTAQPIAIAETPPFGCAVVRLPAGGI